MVAWKDSREARRALFDAIPVLASAKAVNVVEAFEWEEERAAAVARVNDVAAWLALHGVKAAGSAVFSKDDAVADLATAADDLKAGLIVAGSYGHSRLGEWIFGGVTRFLLSQSKRTVLLSH
jgi:nucleotide-binding universal stress UspA family protein